MTKVPVNVPGFTSNVMYTTGKVQEMDTKGDFGKILENQKNAGVEKHEPEQLQKDTVEKVNQKEPANTEVKETEQKDTVQSSEKAQSGQDANKEAGDEELSEEAFQENMAILQSAVLQVKELLMQELGITEEELSELMESMGFEDMDLLGADTLKDMLLEVNGAEDMTAVLTDEGLYAQMQNLESAFDEAMAEVKDQLQMTGEEMNAFKEQAANAEQPVIVVEAEETAETKDESTPQENTNAFANLNGQSVNMQDTVAQTENAQTAEFMSAETEDIMNQIMDYMKIQLNADTETLEMQLHPESLGTLQIRIAAKEGIMTAQFTTASETVKAALESQMVQLQQQFENQNIKVEAIEVTVQTHQFESALEQGEEKQQPEESKKNRVRKIDLSQLEEAEEEIPEEDRLVAEMMAANGNTVDYLA